MSTVDTTEPTTIDTFTTWVTARHPAVALTPEQTQLADAFIANRKLIADAPAELDQVIDLYLEFLEDHARDLQLAYRHDLRALRAESVDRAAGWSGAEFEEWGR